MNQHSSRNRKYYSPLIGAALAAVSLFHFSLPAFAVGTDAGLQLRNRATATYDDNGTETYEVISNEVTVTVGKIAGITNVPTTYQNNTTPGATVLPGNSVSFDFLVTNTGNDVSKIFIPSATVINNNATNISINGGEPTSVQISVNGGAFFNRPADGIIDGDPNLPAPNTNIGVVENTSIIVRVTGTVNPLANVLDEIRVRLGDTGGNIADTSDPNFPTTQNQPDAGGGSDPQEQDVRTLNGDDADTDVDGDPANGQREASATHLITVGSNPLALTRIEKTNAGVDINGTPEKLDDDIITYNLELDVLAQKLARYNNFAFNPAALEGRDLSATVSGTAIGANNTNLILISDAIPGHKDGGAANANSTLLSENIPAVGNWIPVYSSTPLTTAADAATWSSDAPADQNARNLITRVGWVYDANTNPALTPGTTVTSAAGGFTFKVRKELDLPGSIYNMAQVFGTTDDGNAATITGTETFDESGDENPNNLSDDGTTFTPDNDLGVADPGTGEDNVDVDGDNTQEGSLAGEVNKVVIAAAPVTPDILNGPVNQPQAVGGIFDTTPADNNHDFQNLAAPTPALTAQDVDGSGNPNPETAAATTITFTNTVQNTETGDIADVKLEPVLPTELGLDPGNKATVLPDNTTIAITYNGRTVTYTKTGGGTPVLNPTSFSNPGGAATPDQDTPITLNVPGTGTLPVGSNSVNYTVVVTLPADTPLSTNGDINNSVGGYDVPIAAYVDDSIEAGVTDDTPDPSDTYNITVNQVYLGYLKLAKQGRVLRDYDPVAGVTDGVYVEVPGMGFADPNSAKLPAPGDIIEYQVTYSNISEPQGTGSNNVILDAENVTITEDGTGTVGTTPNNWGIDGANDTDTIIDTLHVPGEAGDSNGGTIAYFSGATGSDASNDGDKEVTKYVDTVGTVTPGNNGTFTFQRKVTHEDDIEELTP